MLFGREPDGLADPGEVFVEVDSEHLAAGEAHEILRQDRLCLIVGPEEHDPDLDLHAAAIGGPQRRRILDLLLHTPAHALVHGYAGYVGRSRLDVHSSASEREERLEDVSLGQIVRYALRSDTNVALGTEG